MGRGDQEKSKKSLKYWTPPVQKKRNLKEIKIPILRFSQNSSTKDQGVGIGSFFKRKKPTSEYSDNSKEMKKQFFKKMKEKNSKM